MAEALENGTVSKYITDFPTPDVLKMKNTIAIPHLGASTAEAEDNCAIMATRQLMDFIENGNIKNSVNFPNCDLGPASQVAGRIGVMHENVPNMISQITGALGNADVNIENMMNKAKGKFAYTLLDLNAPASQSIVAALSEIEGVIRTRIIV
ncbi:MAG: 3-phosphoglycerate dehydrogenase, partial [Coriobacteriales bacterium]|nr:3-phosphoglycerate dehydrogenase [Coriobacteriales bacterium]